MLKRAQLKLNSATVLPPFVSIKKRSAAGLEKRMLSLVLQKNMSNVPPAFQNKLTSALLRTLPNWMGVASLRCTSPAPKSDGAVERF